MTKKTIVSAERAAKIEMDPIAPAEFTPTDRESVIDVKPVGENFTITITSVSSEPVEPSISFEQAKPTSRHAPDYGNYINYSPANPNRVGPGHADYDMLGQYWVKNGKPFAFTFNERQKYQVIRDNEGFIFLKVGGELGASASYGDLSTS